MKIIGSALLFFALYFSWAFFSYKGELVAKNVHASIQKTLSKKIIDMIVTSHPKAHDIEALNFETYSVNEKTINAQFEFSFEEEDALGKKVKVSKVGSAVVLKEKEEQGQQFWQVKDISLKMQKFYFEEGLTFGIEEFRESN